MIIKTGIDVIEVSRIKSSIEKFDKSFLNRVFTKKEIEYCESKKVQKYQSYAGRFAAKEAIFKAFSEFIDNKFDIEWKNIEVLNDDNGRPYANLTGNLKKKLCDFSKSKDYNYEIDVSISHISQLAVANAVIKMEV